MSMSRFRTIKQCFQFVKETDKESAITLYFIRNLCTNNEIEYKVAGRKILVNFDSLINYLKMVKEAS